MTRRAAPAVLLFVAALAGGCRVRPCREQTAFLTVVYDETARTATEVAVAVVAGDGQVSERRTRTAGRADGTYELDLAAYQAGEPISVSVDALLDGKVIGSGHTARVLDPGCTALAVNVTVGGVRPPVSFSLMRASLGAQADALASGDLDGDRHADLVAVIPNGYEVRVLWGRGDGTFDGPARLSVGGTPMRLALADYDGRSGLDVAVTEAMEGQVVVLPNAGGRAFEPPLPTRVTDSPRALVSLDFDGGHPDLAVTTSGSAARVHLLRGKGDGTFIDQSHVFGGAGDVASGDLDGDGVADLVTIGQGGRLSVLLGLGGGSFAEPTTTTVGRDLRDIALGDWNGDGATDVAASVDSTMAILLARGDGTLRPPALYTIAGEPRGIAAGDFDADGILDLAVANGGEAAIAVLRGRGDGSFQMPASVATTAAVHSIVAADFDGDGRMDLAASLVGSNDIALLLSRAP